MKAFKFLAADVKVLKNYKIQLLIMLAVIVVMFWRSNAFIAINSLMFIGILLTSLPFTIESAEKPQTFYYTLPAKRSSMVASRYIILALYYIIVAIVDVIVLLKIIPAEIDFNGINLKPFYICTTALVYLIGVLISSVQYPAFYKFGYEKGSINSAALYMAPAIVILFIFSSMSKDASKLSANQVYSMFLNNISATVILAAIASVILIIASFIVSCKFVNSKEIK